MPIIGDPLPLQVQLYDGASDFFPRATVYLPDGTVYDTVSLEEVADGLYLNETVLMPNRPSVIAQYEVFSDEDHGTPAPQYQMASESFFLSSGGGSSSFPPTSNILAFVNGEPCTLGPVEDVIVQGCDRTLTIRLASAIDGTPFNIALSDAIEFRMRKTDGTVLSVTLLSGAIEIVNGGGGQIAVTLSGDDTADLAAAIPAPATIKVTIDSVVTVINLATQLAVEEVEVEEAEV